jgi:transcriptional regulator with XRE-family HTH domain
MDWSDVRMHYYRLFTASGLTQTQVANAAGFNQSTLQKLLSNDKQGPAATTLLKAIRGLGMLPSEFFASLEHALVGADAASGPLPRQEVPRGPLPPTCPDPALRQLQKDLKRLAREVADLRHAQTSASAALRAAGAPRSRGRGTRPRVRAQSSGGGTDS